MDAVKLCRRFAVWVLFLSLTTFLFGQQSAPRRISQTVDDSAVARLKGSVSPRVRTAIDQGSAPGAMPLQRLTMFFQPSATQEQQLADLLRQQQDPKSVNFRKWLTPEQYGERFGMHPADLAAVSAWLGSHGFSNIATARSRTYIEFEGTAGQAQSAFRTSIHRMVRDGETHYANTTEPALPNAFAGLVSGISSLNDFRPRPKSVAHFTSSISGKHFLAPGDIATIYNIKGLYDSGIDGTGQTIAVVGQTKLSQTGSYPDIVTFRSLGGLPALNLQTVLVGTDPGVLTSDIDEANLDVEWSGAVARNAKIIFYYSNNALFSSLKQAITDNTAAVISVSYGNCEASFSTSDISTLTNLTQQANSQGQTITTAAGDSGAADCDGTAANPATIATHGLAVDIPSALQNVTAMGGTEFTGDSDATVTNGVAADTQYWKGSSSKTDTSATAISYIPETVWNDNSTDISATGGGASKLIAKPSWQTGNGVPADGQRDVPDISLSSSPNHDGYLICSQGTCVNGYRRADDTLNVIGGTSAASPAFAGVVALMNQKFATRMGNVNQTLYSLAASSSNAFHDITTGDNKVPCQKGTPDCPNGGTIGYSAGPGYDQASGLGSIDVGALVAAWNNTISPDFSLTANPSSLSLTRGSSGQSSISIGAIGPFAEAVNLTCTVSASLGATTCSFNPASITPGQTSTLTVTATNSARMEHPASPVRPGWPFDAAFGMIAALFVVPRAGAKRRAARNLRTAMLFTLACTLVLASVSCGGGSSGSGNSGGGAGGGNSVSQLTGTVTVQGTSGTLTHSTVVTVVIN